MSTSRTGSTALLRAFANHPDVVAVYQPIKDGCRDLGGTDEDYRVYEQHHPAFESHHGKVYVSKEVTAYAVRGTPVNVFRSDAEMARVRPVFLIRDPLGAWRSMRPLITKYTAATPFATAERTFFTAIRPWMSPDNSDNSASITIPIAAPK